jgi:site-specific DNA recombinase
MMRSVIYTRFSSDRQREASIEDQARNCRRRIDSEGWQLVEHFKDEAISGATAARPGYQAMLKAAAAREFDVLLMDDLSRLSRDSVEQEQTIRSLEYRGLRLIAVSDGYDSSSKARKLHRGFKGLMNEAFLDDLREKTHRGLEGQALKAYWAGGRPYGYRLIRIKDPTRLDAHGEPLAIGTRLEIDPDTIPVVLEIFQRFADGWSPRAIADELNRRGVPSPGSTWRNRRVRRTCGWMGSAIKPILRNSLYRGMYVWNRSAWGRDPDTGRRRVVARPKSEWVRSELPELRIVSEELWQCVKARDAAAERAGANIRQGIRRTGHQPGRQPAYLFSSLLRCGLCNAAMVIVGGQGKWKSYGCSTRKEGGAHACTNSLTAKLPIVEARLLRRIKEDLLSDELVAEVEGRYAKARAQRPKERSADERIAQLQSEVKNLTDAIASGALRSSKALAQRLSDAEEELERLTSARANEPKVVKLPMALGERYRRLVGSLESELGRDVHKARTALRQIVGDQIPVLPHESGKHLVAKIGLDTEALMASGDPESFVVAGARYTMSRT